jgi:hypothetical protein
LRQLAIDHMKICAAYGTGAYADEKLAWPRFGYGQLRLPQSCSGFFKKHCPHKVQCIPVDAVLKAIASCF